MTYELTGWQKFTATVAKWIVINIAARINGLAVLSLCIEVARDYQERYIQQIEAEEPNE
jgi:hypothetical protein